MKKRHDRKLLEDVLRADIYSFLEMVFHTLCPDEQFHPNWHLEAVNFLLMLCFKRKKRRVIFNLPPRSLKSMAVSVAFVAWAMGRNPSLRFLCVSYSADLAEKHHRDFRTIVESEWFRKLFPAFQIDPRKNTTTELATTMGGFRLAVPAGGSITGRGGSFIIIDDPLKSEEAFSEAERSRINKWFDTTVSSRLDNKNSGVIIVVMQRLHIDDLVGHLLQGRGWHHLVIPAISESEETVPIGPVEIYLRKPGEILHPEITPSDFLQDLRLRSPFVFASQYQQSPIVEGGNLIKWEWFPFYDQLPGFRAGDYFVQSWDTASTGTDRSSFSVCTTWLVRGNEYFLRDVFRERLDYPSLKAAVLQLCTKWPVHNVLIEEADSGRQLLQELKGSRAPRGVQFEAVKPVGNKIQRISIQADKIYQGRVILPRSARWLDPLREEVLVFPDGKFDDQLDSIAQFLAWTDGHRSWFAPPPPITPRGGWYFGPGPKRKPHPPRDPRGGTRRR